MVIASCARVLVAESLLGAGASFHGVEAEISRTAKLKQLVASGDTIGINRCSVVLDISELYLLASAAGS